MKLSQITWIAAMLVAGLSYGYAQARDCDCLPGVTVVSVIEKEDGQIPESCIISQCPRGAERIKVVDGRIVSYKPSSDPQYRCVPQIDENERVLSGTKRNFQIEVSANSVCRHAVNKYNFEKSK